MKKTMCLAWALACVGAVVSADETDGWRNVDASRHELDPARVYWRADFARTNDFTVETFGGACGTVRFDSGELVVEKKNAAGCFIVRGSSFPVPSGTALRLAADVSVDGAEPDYSHGLLRLEAADGTLPLCTEIACGTLVDGGAELMCGLVNSPPDVFYRKYAHGRASGCAARLAIVVSGAPSVSRWRNWTAEDLDAAQAKWRDICAAKTARDRSAERMDEAAFDRGLAQDTDHTAVLRCEGNVTRLFVDGRPAAPIAYHAKGSFGADALLETFAGGPLVPSGVRLMVKSVNFGTGDPGRLYWTKDGFDARGAVEDIKRSMRLAPDALFIVCASCNAYPDFTRVEHPDEVWRREDGSVVCGTAGSCLEGYDDMGIPDTNRWPWVSYASPSWRAAIEANIVRLVDELKRTGLSKRIVGIHLAGYHDGQFYSPFTDCSPCARAEYKAFLSEGGHVSTNYPYFSKLLGLRAQEGFARAFKRAMGKDVIAIRWCDSVWCGSHDITAFALSDALDVTVAQPWYPRRHPAIPTEPKLPFSSFARHGKMLWTECDLRTYGALESWATSVVATKGLGQADDFGAWQTISRKYAGSMFATRSGYWYYDMGGGFYDPPEIAADIARTVRVGAELAAAPASPWRPDVAIVFDQAGALGWAEGREMPPAYAPLNFPMQHALIAASGVPYEFYLAEDVLEHPELLDGMKSVVLANFRKFDARRTALLTRLTSKPRTIFLTAETGILGGAKEALGLEPVFMREKREHRVVPAAGVPEDEAASALEHCWTRSFAKGTWPPDPPQGPRGTVVETADMKVYARYADDGMPALVERRHGAARILYSCEYAAVTPQLFNRLVRESGAYVPVNEGGRVQIDMNGDFVSIHALKNGPLRFRLPFACRVTNLKTGRAADVSKDGSLAMDLTAGEIRWYRLEKDRVKFVAHRGAGDLTMPEASLSAYSNAVATACDIVKLDVQQTRDGVIVMGHDPSLKRTMGWDVKIADLDYESLKSKVQSLKLKGEKGRIVRLDEALAVAKGVPEFWLDFKAFSPEMAERALADFGRAGIAQSRIMVATFTEEALEYFRDKHPDIRRVGHVSFWRERKDGRDYWASNCAKDRLYERTQDALCDVLAYRDRLKLWGVNMPIADGKTTRDGVAFLKEHGLWVSLWFVQENAQAAQFRDSGADAFVTDHVSALVPKEEAKRPYEIVRAGRTADEFPSVARLESADGWRVECSEAEATFTTETNRALFGSSVTHLAYRATGSNPVIRVIAPKPIEVPDGADTVSLWVNGNNVFGNSEYEPPYEKIPCVRITAEFGGKGESGESGEKGEKGEKVGQSINRLIEYSNNRMSVGVGNREEGIGNRCGIENPSQPSQTSQTPQTSQHVGFVYHKDWSQLIGVVTNGVGGRGSLPKDMAFTGFTVTGGVNRAWQSIDLTSLCVYRDPQRSSDCKPRAKRGVQIFADQPQGLNVGAGKLPFPTREETVIPPAVALPEKLEFQLPKDLSDWSDLKFRYAGSPWIPLARGGGVLPRTLPAGAKVMFRQVANSLVCDIVSPEPGITAVLFGMFGAPTDEITFIAWPYYTLSYFHPVWDPAIPDGYSRHYRPRTAMLKLGGRTLFVGATFDWTQSNASVLYYPAMGDATNRLCSGVLYEPKTDGRRNGCYERFVWTFSEDVTDVLPSIPNPVSPWKHVAGTHSWSVCGARDHAKDAAYWRAVKQAGIDHVVINDHETEWRDDNESFTFRTESAPRKGGDAGQVAYTRTLIDELGFCYGPYNNFTDYAPVNAYWSIDHVTRRSDGQLRPGWNRCYAPKPTWAVGMCEYLAPIIKRKFGFNTAYCDVHTAVAPWGRTDFDARELGAGTFAQVFYCFGEIMLLQKAAWGGPVYSEGGIQWLYSGLTDGNYAQDPLYDFEEQPWLVDFDLKRIHPLCCNFGMGTPWMFYGRHGSELAKRDRQAFLDRFTAATLAFGHPGFLFSQRKPDDLSDEKETYFPVQAIAARYTQAEAKEIRYGAADGSLHDVSAALANGAAKRSQLKITYSDGTVVAVNGSWTENFRVEVGGVVYDLPPNGWRAETADKSVVSFNGFENGRRVRYARSPEYRWEK